MAWVIVGLGNPGGEYEKTRHNAGRMAAEHFGENDSVGEWRTDKKAVATLGKADRATIVLPDTYMNKSGSAVARYVKSAKAAEKLIVAYDDLDLPLGTIRISYDRGSGGHKGVESIMRALKTKKFIRLRIGVSRATKKGAAKKPQGEEEVIDFILAKFKPPELEALAKLWKTTDEAFATIIAEGKEKAMNVFNSL